MGATTLTVASGGKIDVESGGTITDDGTQASHIANAVVNYTTGDLDSEAELITAINAANTKINSILTALEGVGILAAS
ncbi:MAG: hypothetical protein V2A54_10035 [Bacteroidota bacterium]